MGIESEEVAKGLDGDDGAGVGLQHLARISVMISAPDLVVCGFYHLPLAHRIDSRHGLMKAVLSEHRT